MAPTAAARNLKGWVVSLGGKAIGNEEQLIVICRKRLNQKFARFDESDDVATSAFLYGVAPVLGYLRNAVPAGRWQSFSSQVLAEHIFDAFKVLAPSCSRSIQRSSTRTRPGAKSSGNFR